MPMIQAVLTPDRPEKRQNGRRFKEDGEPSFTLTQQDKHGVFDGMQIRRLTPTECERLQGFEDGWTEGVSDTQRYKQCGNAVTTKVIKSIVEQLIVGKFTQNSTSSGFPTENSPNISLKESSEEDSQISSNDETSLNNNIKLNNWRCLK